jgi:hypothetical protein
VKLAGAAKRSTSAESIASPVVGIVQQAQRRAARRDRLSAESRERLRGTGAGNADDGNAGPATGSRLGKYRVRHCK